MNKKDRMLQYITSNVNWFMTTSTSVQVIPYYELSNEDFNRAKQYFANDAQYEDVVCLISTSVMNTGKSGILFTVDCVYNKAWGGIFTGCYKNPIRSFNTAEFDIINEFDIERMRELMSDLTEITLEDEKEQFNETLKDVGTKIGKTILLGMGVVDVISSLQDYMVEQKNTEIYSQLESLEENTDEEMAMIVQKFKEILPHQQEFIQIVQGYNNSNASDVDMAQNCINSLNELLLELYYQTQEIIDATEYDMEEYANYDELVKFWALLFGNEKQFKQKYNQKIFESAPEYWKIIIDMTDATLENEGQEAIFSEIVSIFSSKIIENFNKIIEITENIEWDGDDDDEMEEVVEKYNEIVGSNIEVVKMFNNALDVITDYLNEVLS